MQVGHGEVLIDLILTVHVDDLTENAHRTTHILGTLGCPLHGDTDDNLSTHLASKISRVVVFQTTIHQHLITDSDRRKGGGDSHRGTHGLWQPSAVEIHLAVFDDVCGYAGKGDGQVAVKVERVGKSHAQLLEQLGQVLALDDTTGLHVTLADGQARREQIRVLLLAVAKALTAHILLVSDDVTPVLYTHHRVERVGIIANGVETADDTTHRRTGNDVDGNARPL